jgi:tetratricopeptide (TPR) repeat protein
MLPIVDLRFTATQFNRIFNTFHNRDKTMDKKNLSKQLFGSMLVICALINHAVFANPEGMKAYEDRDLIEAKRLFSESLDVEKSNPTALHYLAKIALNEGEFDQAEEYIEKAIEAAPIDAAVHFDAARIMGAQAQDSSMFSAPGYAKDALKAFKKAAELEPETIQYRQGLMSFYLQAPGFLGGDEKLAMAEANAIAQLDPAQGFVALANVYQSTDKEEQLALHYASVDDKYPDNASILFNRGLYYQTQEEFSKAVSDFKKVQTLKPSAEDDQSRFAAQYQVGRSSVLSKSNYEEGIQSLQQYLDSAPDADGLPSKAWAKYRLGILYKQTGDKKMAKSLYKQARAETKDKQLLKSLKKSLKKLK